MYDIPPDCIQSTNLSNAFVKSDIRNTLSGDNRRVHPVPAPGQPHNPRQG